MTDAEKQTAEKDVTIAVAGHVARVKFETIALSLIVIIVVLSCVVGFWSDALAARVVQLHDSITDFLGVLATTLGFSLTRGHMDRRVDAQNGAP